MTTRIHTTPPDCGINRENESELVCSHTLHCYHVLLPGPQHTDRHGGGNSCRNDDGSHILSAMMKFRMDLPGSRFFAYYLLLLDDGTCSGREREPEE